MSGPRSEAFRVVSMENGAMVMLVPDYVGASDIPSGYHLFMNGREVESGRSGIFGVSSIDDFEAQVRGKYDVPLLPGSLD